jgi:cold shock CspA family protein
MFGTTIKYDRVKGYGFILPDDETLPDFFVLAKCILEPKGRRWLMAGWRVEFTPVEVGDGMQAQNVRVLSRPIAIQRSVPKLGGAK